MQQIDSDSIIGGTGDDTVNSYQNRVADLYVDLSEPRRDGQRGEGDDLSGVERLFGGDGDDRLYGDGDANFIFGDAGDDDIAGRGGDDQLVATQGDTASGDLGRDRIAHLPGLDRLHPVRGGTRPRRAHAGDRRPSRRETPVWPRVSARRASG